MSIHKLTHFLTLRLSNSCDSGSDRNVHRNEVLTATALEFMRAWVEVMTSDMDSKSVHKLQSLMDTNVQVHFGGGLDCASHQAQV